jgi:hypothetical protein
MADNDYVYIDPHFFKPPNVVDLRDTVDEGDSFGGVTEGETLDGGGTTGGVFGGLPVAPSTFEIVEQLVRQPAGGQSVIDLVIEVPDQMGVIRYEVRLSKQ